MATPDFQTQEPDVPHKGLNVQDFGESGLLSSVRNAVRLLPRRKRRTLFLAACVQMSLAVLDLIGIALIGLVAAVAVSGFGVDSIPPAAQSAIDAVGLGGLTVSQLSVVIALSAVGILIFKTIASAFLTRWIMRFLAGQQADVSTRLARGFLALPLADVLRWTTSEAIYALGAGVSAATTSLLGSAITIAAETFLFLIVGVSLFLFDPVLTISALLFFGTIVFLLHRVLARWTARNAETMKDASIETLTAVSEALATYRESMVLNRRELYVAKYESLVGRYAVSGASNAFILEVPKYVLEAALYLGVVLLGVVEFLTSDWGSAAATVAIFLAASSRVTPAILRLQGAGITIRNASVAAQPTFFMSGYLADRGAETGDKEPASRMTAQRIHEHLIAGYDDFDASVIVDRISHTYPDAPEPALADVSIRIPAGSSVAFVGSTGAGKSTLTDVVLGVLEPQLGTVTISGLSPKAAIDRWPGAIAYVPQAVALVGGSVRENVALGLPRAVVDDELVWAALRRAHLAEFLIESREGLDTPVGERGFRLSGGQRQRLGIARALYTRPKLLVLDEATSALDSETEQAIIQTLAELEGEVTTITVAHRLATVRNCDELLYIDGGRVIARGSFAEVRQQVEGFDRQASLLGL